jgi:hypothetical protein
MSLSEGMHQWFARKSTLKAPERQARHRQGSFRHPQLSRRRDDAASDVTEIWNSIRPYLF